jgi:hypothetical protein
MMARMASPLEPLTALLLQPFHRIIDVHIRPPADETRGQSRLHNLMTAFRLGIIISGTSSMLLANRFNRVLALIPAQLR